MVGCHYIDSISNVMLAKQMVQVSQTLNINAEGAPWGYLSKYRIGSTYRIE